MLKRRNNKGQSVTLSDKDIAERIEIKYPSFEYIGGYTGCDGKIYLMCKTCGSSFSHGSHCLRLSNTKKIFCNHCIQIKKEIKQRTEKTTKRIKILHSIKHKDLYYKECYRCGNLFMTIRENQKFCSNQCANRQYESNREHLRRATNNKHDDISLNELINRDNNVCYICNKVCNKKDYIYKGKTFIAGNYYPSIDHVKALANGGTHTWDNVRLAHRICNSIKSNR